MPTVSVIMNCHNGAQYLAEAIDSVYAQTFQDFEIIFYNNASTDHSAQIAAGYDERLRIIKNNGKLETLGNARKKAVKKARGDWLAFLDTDDAWLPHKLQKQMSALSGKDYALAYAGIETMDTSGHFIREEIPRHSTGNLFGCLLRQFEINMPTAMVSKAFIDEQGLNFDEMMEASEEYNLFMQIAANGRVLVMKEVLAKYRLYDTSLTFEKIERWAFERRHTLKLLERTAPKLVALYNVEFLEANSRAMYYQACSLMQAGKSVSARAELKKATIAGGWKYRLLHWLAHAPLFWRLCHDPLIKARFRALLRPIL